MTKYLLALIVAFITGIGTVAPAAESSKIGSSYNKVRDETNVEAQLIWIAKNVSLEAAYRYPGEKPSRPEFASLRFTAIRQLQKGENLKWQMATAIYLRYGDTKLSLPRISYLAESRTTRSKALFGKAVVAESVICHVPVETFVALSQSPEVLWEVVDKSGSLSGETLAPIIELARSVPLQESS